MQDVAEAAGVSITTVSHVLNGTRFVSSGTHARVIAAVEATGYQRDEYPSPATPKTLGLLVSETSYAYFSEVVQGAETAARSLGYHLILARSREDASLERQAIAAMIAHRVDGILLAPTANWRTDSGEQLLASDLPFVLLDRGSTMHCDQVLTENVQPSQSLVEHLVQLGHSRIAILKGYPHLSTSSERLAGYLRALERHDLPIDDELIIEGGSDVRGGRHGMRALLKRADPPTAVFCSNDAMTVGALLALGDAGRRVPEDIAVVAFDDFEWADAFSPALTTAAQPAYAVGDRGVRLLVQRIANPSRQPQVVRLPAEVVHRTSCGCRPEGFRATWQ